MTPDQITQLRTKVKRVIEILRIPVEYDLEADALLAQILALLPCPTCNGMGIMMRCVVKKDDGELLSQDPEPCPDCK